VHGLRAPLKIKSWWLALRAGRLVAAEEAWAGTGGKNRKMAPRTRKIQLAIILTGDGGEIHIAHIQMQLDYNAE
jgi:hypothetical protein